MIAFFLLLLGSALTDEIPEYLAVEAQGEPQMPISEFSIKGFQQLQQKFADDQELMTGFSDLLVHLRARKFTKWTDATPWHVTCLYIGQNYSQLDTSVYKKFVPGLQIPIKSNFFVFVPDRLMIGMVDIDREAVPIQNKYPHSTLFRKKWPAVNSNYVLEALFEEDGPLHGYYDKVLHDDDFTLVKKFENILIDKEYVTVYVSKINKKPLILDGLTKEMF